MIVCPTSLVEKDQLVDKTSMRLFYKIQEEHKYQLSKEKIAEKSYSGEQLVNMLMEDSIDKCDKAVYKETGLHSFPFFNSFFISFHTTHMHTLSLTSLFFFFLSSFILIVVYFIYFIVQLAQLLLNFSAITLSQLESNIGTTDYFSRSFLFDRKYKIKVSRKSRKFFKK